MTERVFSHVFNGAKLRILLAAFEVYPKPVTCKEIAAIAGLEAGRVARLMSHYTKYKYHYFRKLPKRGENNGFRYKLNGTGIKALGKYVRRVKLGIDLNVNRKKPIRMSTFTGYHPVSIKTAEDMKLTPEQIVAYTKLSYRGKYELGLKEEELLTLTGLVKSTETDEDDFELEEIINRPVKKTNADIAREKREQLKELFNRRNTTQDPIKKKLAEAEIENIKSWLKQNPEILKLL